jgi:putative alpha-1,2-mannosidase
MLKGKQKKLDANKDGKISGDDFKMLQSKKGMKSGGDAVVNVVKDVAEGAGSSASLGKAIKSILKKSDKKPEKKFKGGSIFSRQNYKRTGKI